MTKHSHAKPPRNATLAEKLVHYGHSVSASGCWIFGGTIAGNGYGQFGHDYRLVLAHRASYEAHMGPIPPGSVVCHRCDNPACINPTHLFVGSQSENLRDMRTKGRGTQGESVPASKLTAADVAEIRRDFASGTHIDVLTARYPVGRRTIYKVVERRSWKHVA